MTSDELLQAGIAAAHAGDLNRAKSLLAQVVQADPKSEQAWLWLGLSVAAPDQREYCFRRVLALNPNNATARQKLLELPPPPAHPQPQLTTASPGPQPLPPVTPPAQTEEAPPSAPPALPKRARVTPRLAVATVAFMLGLCVVGAPLLYLVLSGRLDSFATAAIAQIATPTVPPTATPTPTSTIPTATPLPSETFTPTPVTPTPTTTPTLDATFTFGRRLESAQLDIAQAKALMRDGKYAEAVPYWDKVISKVPDYGDAFYQRALCYLELIHNQRFESEYVDYLKRALADLDQAIALGPVTGDHYLARYRVYDRLAGEEHYRVDFDVLEAVALENLRVANELGNSDELSNRTVPFVLYNLGRCEEGLAEGERLIAAQPADAALSAGLNTILAYGYVCLGQFDKALRYIDTALQIYPSFERKFKRAIILYNLGRLDEALAQLNETIEESPYYCGCRYYLRALIYDEQGKPDLARADIEFGSGQTWGRGGLYAYVLGRLALDASDRESGTAFLQDAEASLTREYGPLLLKRIQQELAQLNASPLVSTPSVAITVTPIPTLKPELTPRPSTIVLDSGAISSLIWQPAPAR